MQISGFAEAKMRFLLYLQASHSLSSSVTHSLWGAVHVYSVFASDAARQVLPASLPPSLQRRQRLFGACCHIRVCKTLYPPSHCFSLFLILFSPLTFWIIFMCLLNQTGCCCKVNTIWDFFFSFSVFDHFLHFPSLSYGSFTTSHKSLFLWIPWNQSVNTLRFFTGLHPAYNCFSHCPSCSMIHIYLAMPSASRGLFGWFLSTMWRIFVFVLGLVDPDSISLLALQLFDFISNLFLVWL